MLYEEDLDVVLQEIMTRWGIPGLAVGIVKGNEIVYVKGFGVQSLETHAPATLDSFFAFSLYPSVWLPPPSCNWWNAER